MIMAGIGDFLIVLPGGRNNLFGVYVSGQYMRVRVSAVMLVPQFFVQMQAIAKDQPNHVGRKEGSLQNG